MSDVMKMYGTVTVSTDGLAAMDIPEDGAIVGLSLDVAITGADVLNDGAAVELSFASTSGFANNDTRSSLVGCRVYQGFLTTGGSQVGKTVTIAPLNIVTFGGERLYLHSLNNGTVAVYATCFVYFQAKAKGGRPPRRVRL